MSEHFFAPNEKEKGLYIQKQRQYATTTTAKVQQKLLSLPRSRNSLLQLLLL